MSIVTVLPAIRPTTRGFRMDRWPQKEVKMRGGRTAKWPLVNTPAGASLDLLWENITHAEAEQLAAVWDTNYGLYGAVALDAATLAGLDAGLAALVQQPFPGCEWRAQSPPVIESVKAGRCTVRLPLRTRPGLGGALTVSPLASYLGSVKGVVAAQWSAVGDALGGYSGSSVTVTPATWTAESLYLAGYTGSATAVDPADWEAIGQAIANWNGSLFPPTTAPATWEAYERADWTGSDTSITPATWEAYERADWIGSSTGVTAATWEASVAGDAFYTGSSMTTTPGTWTATDGSAGATSDSLAKLYEDDLLELF